MKLSIIIIIIMYLTAVVNAQNWEGRWEGKIKAGPQELRIVFNIQKSQGAALAATMDSPDQMVYDLEMDEVNTKDNTIIIKFKAGNAEYTGQLSEDNNSIKGKWIQGMEFPLELIRSNKKSNLRPQEPQGPFPYRIEEVTYPHKKAKIELAGTLTIPEGSGKFPVVILISGSGPQDRDETILQHKPFWVLADYLTRKGIAVLRVDDRGVGKSTGSFGLATSVDFAEDVVAGVQFLKKHPSINTKKIGLIGHSEGGLIASMVASKNKDIAFAVLLAGPGLAGKDLLMQQTKDLMELGGASQTQVQAIQAINSKLYTAIVDDKKGKLTVDDLMNLIQEDLAQISEEDKQATNLEDASLRQGITTLQSSWMRFFLAANPSDYLKKVKCPILALNGDKDVQVAGKVNLDIIEKALQTAKNTNFQCVLLPNLNHLFQNCETGAISEYIQIEETFAPEAMDLIFDFIEKLL